MLRLKFVLYGMLLLLVMAVSTASASLWKIDATVVDPNTSLWGNFSVIFEVTNGEFGEGWYSKDSNNLVWFSGVPYGTGDDPPELNTLVYGPNLGVDGINVFGYDSGAFSGKWGFNNGGASTAAREVLGTWSYTATSVPVPAAVWLLGSGLLGLVSFRRKRNA